VLNFEVYVYYKFDGILFLDATPTMDNAVGNQYQQWLVDLL